jgi:N-acetylmuramoyl-L-alanine amidase
VLRTFTLLFFLLLNTPALAGVLVSDVRLGLQDGGATRFVMELSEKVKPDLFLLNNPPRLVLDLPPLTLREELQPASKGLVKGWRSGQFGEGTRVVLDLTGPAKASRVEVLPPREGKGARLLVDLVPVAAGQFGGLVRRPNSATQTPVSANLIKVMVPPKLPEQRQPQDTRPLIVIDAGHGGVDPGAIAVTGLREKDLTLMMARRLATQLESSGNYRVKLTRNRDKFISLPGRVKISRGSGADLFISLHADSIRGREVRGATIYTLSDKASDKEAAELAESENRADALAGLEQVEDNDTAASILIDMSHRAALNDGRSFAGSLVKAFRETGIRMTDNPQRAAGFAVLKAPDVPAVLIEMGYLSSSREAQLLMQAEYQQKLVSAIESATNNHFKVSPAMAAAGR